MYKYKIFHNFSSECEKILKDMENKSYLNFFQDFEFLKKLVGKSENIVKFVIIFREDEAIAVLPFEIKKYFIFNVLQWLGTDYADYCNPILSKNFNTNLDKTTFLDLWKKILKELGKLGLGADVVSIGELMKALKSGIKPNKIVFSGVGKNTNEIDYAIKKKILLINAESKNEILNIEKIAKINKKKYR